MNYLWTDFIGNIGVVLVLATYILLQLERMTSTSVWYSALNAVGAVLILVSLAVNFNLSSFIIEVFWLAISFFGIVKAMRTKSGDAK